MQERREELQSLEFRLGDPLATRKRYVHNVALLRTVFAQFGNLDDLLPSLRVPPHHVPVFPHSKDNAAVVEDKDGGGEKAQGEPFTLDQALEEAVERCVMFP